MTATLDGANIRREYLKGSGLPYKENREANSITKTRLYNFDPLQPHFYIVKLGFTGVYIIFSYFCSKT